MKDEAIRIAIAEFCGHTNIRFESHTEWDNMVVDYCSDQSRQNELAIPNYVYSLDAMVHAETKLSREQSRDYTRKILPKHFHNLTRDWLLIHAIGSAQRAEAFVKTIGKWRD